MDAKRRKLLGASAGLAFCAAMGAAVTARGAEKVVKVSARRFVFTPNEIALKKGEPVVFELTTEDIFMGFNLPEFRVRSDIVPGKVMRLAVTPDKAGTFTFLCDVFCGDGHESMSGKVIVS
ncbi:MAG: cupredoxin domain-containing protein [Usitatibacter sp.]